VTDHRPEETPVPAPLPHRLRRRSTALVAAAALTLLAGCGGSDGTDDTAAPPASSSSSSAPAPSSGEASDASSSAPADEQGGTLAVTGVDFAFELESTDLAAGEYEVTLSNEGGASHDLRVEQDGEDIAMSEIIPPGETSTFTVALEPGEYVFYCSVGNHRGMGMETTVTVT
jgi:plastocyanin